MIRYRTDLDGIRPTHLSGFFDGWPNRPSPETHLRILEGSDHVVLAIDDQAERVVGFATAITDGVLAAYIPLLEVLPRYRGRGIGGELMRTLLNSLEGYYMIDLVTDQALGAFYAPLGFGPAHAMAMRRRDMQSGRPDDTAD